MIKVLLKIFVIYTAGSLAGLALRKEFNIHTHVNSVGIILCGLIVGYFLLKNVLDNG